MSSPSQSSRTMSAPGELNFRGHILEFDGVRALGVCSVLLGHFWPARMSKIVYELGELGWIPVDGFFVLSGFLIAGILLDKRGKPKYFSTFYLRRTLRIFPLYYMVLLICWLLLRFTNSGHDYREMLQHWGSPMWFTFYAGNIREAMVGAWPNPHGYGPLWSLQIEEQFYLLFPLAVAFLRREHLRVLLICAVVGSLMLRVGLYLMWPQNAFLQFVLLPCHCEGLAIGGLIAIRVRSGPLKIAMPVLTAATVTLLGAAAVGSVLSTWRTLEPAPLTVFARLVGYSLSSAGFGCLLLWVLSYRGTKYTALLRIAPLQYLGRISYGIYMLHAVALMLMLKLAWKGWWPNHHEILFFLATVGLSIAMAAASWHFVELPILQLKNRFGKAKTRTEALSTAANG